MTPGNTTVVDWAYLIFQFNGALDCGKYDELGLDVVEAHVRDGSLLKWLEKTLGDDIDLSIIMSSPDKVETITERIQADWSRRNVTGKMSVENRGLCGLIAICTNVIQ